MVKTLKACNVFNFALLAWLLAGPAVAADWRELRMTMLEEVQADMRRFSGRALSAAVAGALGEVARHEFVPVAYRGNAYDNAPLPIGEEQTISQPFIVALMTELLEPEASDRMLEVGTGSGYQAAVLAALVGEVYSIEIIEALAVSAAERLKRLGYANVFVRHGDGMKGWPAHGPYDGIIVTAAGLDVPDGLLAQLKPGGRLVMPVGGAGRVQQLKMIEKTAAGYTETDVLPVRFVPITDTVR